MAPVIWEARCLWRWGPGEGEKERREGERDKRLQALGAPRAHTLGYIVGRDQVARVPSRRSPISAATISWYTSSLEKPPDQDPFFDDLTRAMSAKELKEHLETRVL